MQQPYQIDMHPDISYAVRCKNNDTITTDGKTYSTGKKPNKKRKYASLKDYYYVEEFNIKLRGIKRKLEETEYFI